MSKVYLSPSMQSANVCKFGDVEKTHCNSVADIVEKYFAASGIEYKRNTSLTNLTEIASDSNKYAPDLHLAIHTNGSNGKVRGHHCYYYTKSAEGKKAAQIFCGNHKKIYSVDGAQNQAIGNVEYTELKKTKAVAVIEETIFHDNEEDAKWYHENEEVVARYIAQSVCDYFDIPLVDPTDYKKMYEEEKARADKLAAELEKAKIDLKCIYAITESYK